jgi:hypothetical protein
MIVLFGSALAAGCHARVEPVPGPAASDIEQTKNDLDAAAKEALAE